MVLKRHVKLSSRTSVRSRVLRITAFFLNVTLMKVRFFDRQQWTLTCFVEPWLDIVTFWIRSSNLRSTLMFCPSRHPHCFLMEPSDDVGELNPVMEDVYSPHGSAGQQDSLPDMLRFFFFLHHWFQTLVLHWLGVNRFLFCFRIKQQMSNQCFEMAVHLHAGKSLCVLTIRVPAPCVQYSYW